MKLEWTLSLHISKLLLDIFSIPYLNIICLCCSIFSLNSYTSALSINNTFKYSLHITSTFDIEWSTNGSLPLVYLTYRCDIPSYTNSLPQVLDLKTLHFYL